MRRLRAKRYAVAMTLTMIGVMQHQPLLIVLAQRLIGDWEFRHRVYHDEIPLALGVKLAPHQLSPDKHRSLYRFEQRDMEPHGATCHTVWASGAREVRYS